MFELKGLLCLASWYQWVFNDSVYC